MSGLTFLQGGFLAALAGLSIPIILHLMNREVPKPIIFPTIRFILKGNRPQQGKRGLRDLLTLLMRLLIFAAAVLLFAQPILRGPAAPVEGKKGRIVIVYDLTPSVERIGWQAFYSEQTKALIEEYNPIEVAAVASAEGIVSELAPTADVNALESFLGGLSITNRPGNHEAALNRATGWLPSENGSLIILTDGQRQDWSASVLPPVASAAPVRIITPENPKRGNLAIQRVTSEVFGSSDSQRLRAIVQVRNFSLEARTAKLRVAVGERESVRDVTVRGDFTEKFVIDLEGVVGTKAVAELQHTDDYPNDDAWHFWIGPRPAFRVGAFADPAAGPSPVDLFFLRHALETSLPGMAKFDLNAMAADQIWEKDLTEFHALTLHDSVRDYTEVELESIRKYVADGGVLIVFCGNLAPECLNNLRANKLTNLRYVGKSGDSSRLKAWSINHLNSMDPALDVFTEEKSDLTTFPIYQLCRLNVPSTGTVLLSVDDTMPFLIRESVGAGTVYTFAAPLNPQWSELPTALSFLPLLRQLLERNRSDNFGVAEVEVGSDPRVAVERLGGTTETFTPTEPGVYLAGGTPVEYNFTRLESDLTSEDSYAIRRRLSKEAGAESVSNAQDDAEGPTKALSPWLAWLLVGALFGELIAANVSKKREES